MPLALADVPAFDRNDLAWDQVTTTDYRNVYGEPLWSEGFSRFHAVGDELLHDLAPLRVHGVIIMGSTQHVAVVPRASPGQQRSP